MMTNPLFNIMLSFCHGERELHVYFAWPNKIENGHNFSINLLSVKLQLFAKNEGRRGILKMQSNILPYCSVLWEGLQGIPLILANIILMNPVPFIKNIFSILLLDWSETQITTRHDEAVKFDIWCRLHTLQFYFQQKWMYRKYMLGNSLKYQESLLIWI